MRRSSDLCQNKFGGSVPRVGDPARGAQRIVWSLRASHETQMRVWTTYGSRLHKSFPGPDSIPPQLANLIVVLALRPETPLSHHHSRNHSSQIPASDACCCTPCEIGRLTALGMPHLSPACVVRLWLYRRPTCLGDISW